MNWTNPPLFANPNAHRTIAGRSYMFINDGAHIHDIGWRQGVSSTGSAIPSTRALTNSQMLAIARSAHPVAL